MKALIMIDIETLALRPKGVITQMAFVAVDAEDLDEEIKQEEMFLPIQPQLDLGRVIDASTILWWMKQEGRAKKYFEESIGDDMDELVSLVQSFVTKLDRVCRSVEEYEIWARGPQFDITCMESLFADTGQETPWAYHRIRDLRTMMSLAGLHTDNVPKPAGLTDHHAKSDCLYQLKQYEMANRKLRADI